MMLKQWSKPATLYVDRAGGQWVVLDRDGNLWTLPPEEDAWQHREPFVPNDETDLTPVPGHYKCMLGLTI